MSRGHRPGTALPTLLLAVLAATLLPACPASGPSPPGALDAAVASACPPAPESCRIMPLGDSLTDGYGVPGGYRVPLFQKLVAAGRPVTFVGSLQGGPAEVDGVPFPRQHEGHNGYTIETAGGRNGIAPLTPEAVRAHAPHLILLMIAPTTSTFSSTWRGRRRGSGP